MPVIIGNACWPIATATNILLAECRWKRDGYKSGATLSDVTLHQTCLLIRCHSLICMHVQCHSIRHACWVHSLSFQLHSWQLKKENGFQTFFSYHTIFSLIICLHLGRHLEYIRMLNDARVASLGIFMDNVCTIRINKEKKSLKSSSRSS